MCLFLITLVLSACQNNTLFKIVPIAGDNIVTNNGDTTLSRTGRFDDFIVAGNFKESSIKEALDKYAEVYADSLKNKYGTYGMEFYREAGDINVKDITATPIQYRWEIFARAEPFYEIRWREGERLK